ncbi:MAG: DoxX family protein [Gemmatimonadota bacterium]
MNSGPEDTQATRRVASIAPAPWHRALHSQAPTATVLIRLMVGGVFMAEGIQKFMYPAETGAGRFARIGIPYPDVMGPAVGVVEVVCGVLVLVGLFTRIAVLPLIVVMCAAIVTTKVPILIGRELGPFALREVAYYGFWGAMHEARTDLSMLLGSLFLLIVGAGRLSADAALTRSSPGKERPPHL